jgi:hypothetical protein
MSVVSRASRMHDKHAMSGGFWFVPLDVAAVDADIAGLVVAAGDTIIADCRTTHLPDHVCRANARAIAALPRLIDALERVEDYFGDLPSKDKRAVQVYRTALTALQEAGVRRRGGL